MEEYIYNIDKAIYPVVACYKACNMRGTTFIYISKNGEDLNAIASLFSFFKIESFVVSNNSFSPYEHCQTKKSEIFFNFKNILLFLQCNNKKVFITDENSLIRYYPSLDIIKKSHITLSINDECPYEYLVELLLSYGYENVNHAYGEGEFATRGSIIDIVTPEHAMRLDFFGDVIESIKSYNIVTQITDSDKISIDIFPVSYILYDFIDYSHIEDVLLSKTNSESKLSFIRYLKEKITYPGEENFIFAIYKKKNLFSIFDFILQDKQNDINIFWAGTKSCIEKIKNKLNEKFLSEEEIESNFYTVEDTFFFPNTEFFVRQNHIYIDYISELSSIILNSENEDQKKIKKFFSTGNISGSDFEKYKNDFSNIILMLKSIGQIVYIQQILDTIPISTHFDIGVKISASIIPYDHSFIYENSLFLSYKDLFQEEKKKVKTKLMNISDNFESGDIVVHKDYGIGRFGGITQLKYGDVYHDYIEIIYYGEDKIFVPVENISLLYRYGQSDILNLDKLNSISWTNRRERAKNRISLISDQLIQTAAHRHQRKSQPIFVNEPNYKKFLENFQFQETEDQKKVLSDILEDLNTGKIIERLICGDTGVGKTEIALRTVFFILDSDKSAQVALIAPTTILSSQHYKTFNNRFKDFCDIKIVELSRNIQRKIQIDSVKKIEKGEIQIVIGTQGILKSKFKNLKLLIVDEEQMFGVEQKEFFKNVYPNIHVISLSATPIPRTLQMSLSNIRDISIIVDQPKNRQPSAIFVIKNDFDLIEYAISKEIKRGGLVYIVSPKIIDIATIESKIADIAEKIGVKYAVATGKIDSIRNDENLYKFSICEIRILLSTNIIQCGIDIPNANTMIVFNSQNFGISQLYQLKGRVGRSNIKSYVYFVISDKATDESKKKIEFIKSTNAISCGMNIATYDMDIRGFGNLIGDEQSGKISEIGFEMYQLFLQEAISSMPLVIDVKVNAHMDIGIPNNYIEDFKSRMQFYKRLSLCENESEISFLYSELVDRFGNQVPNSVNNLFKIHVLKIISSKIGIIELDIKTYKYIMYFHENTIVSDKLIEFFIKNSSKFKFINQFTIEVCEISENIEKMLFIATNDLKEILNIVI